MLKSLHDVPIYAKIVCGLFVRKPGRKPRDPPTIYVLGKLSKLIMGKIPLDKYNDPRNPTVIVHIGDTQIPNVLADLGVSINVMTIKTIQKLGLTNIWPTPTILEITHRSTIKPMGILDDLVVSVGSWEYPMGFLVLQPKSQLGGHPLILGRPWLATATGNSLSEPLT